jgi:NADPH-dependent 2,4-dienoyl-CoA reductase/sulfur reductase-like enzyme
MGHMKFEHMMPYEESFWEKNKIELIQDFVSEILTDKKCLRLKSGKLLLYNDLIIASGSKPAIYNWKGRDAKCVQCLYSKQDLEMMEESTDGIKDAVVVGGGLIGIEMAEMLISRNINVNFIIREAHFLDMIFPLEDSKFIMEHIDHHSGLKFHYSEEIIEILKDDNDCATGVVTNKGNTFKSSFVGLTTGVVPNIEFVKTSKIQTNQGVLVNRHFETNVPHVYAIGDCAEFTTPTPSRNAIEQTWYTARLMGETIAQTLTGHRSEYTPGIWFNSAKFFDLEWQTYGKIGATLEDNEDEFIFQSSNREVMLHFIFDKTNGHFIGINSFGMRLRHLVIDHWLKNKTPIGEVIENLRSANFDSEFYKKYEVDILTKFNELFHTNLKLAEKKWWQNIIRS